MMNVGLGLSRLVGRRFCATNSATNLWFTKDHKYLQQLSNEKIRIGISDHEMEHIGTPIFIAVRNIGTSIKVSDEISTMESCKVTSSLTSPIEGTIIEINKEFVENPKLLSKKQMPDSIFLFFCLCSIDWLVTLKTEENFDKLKKSFMDQSEYLEYLHS